MYQHVLPSESKGGCRWKHELLSRLSEATRRLWRQWLAKDGVGYDEYVCRSNPLVSRYRVIAVPSPRMATQDSTNRQIKPFEGPMLLDGLYGILGTGWGEPTGRRLQGGNVTPVETDGKQQKSGQEFSHGWSSATCCKSFFTRWFTSSVEWILLSSQMKASTIFFGCSEAWMASSKMCLWWR